MPTITDPNDSTCPRLGGAAALVSKAERLKRFHDARNMLRKTMERWDDFMSGKGSAVREGEAEG